MENLLSRYEEEIIRLRRELESRSPQTTAVSSTTANTLTAPIAPTAAPNNSLSNGNSNAFSYQPPPLLSHNPLQQSASAPLPYGGSNDIPSTPLSLLGNEHAKKMDPMRSHHMQHPQYQPMPMNGNSRGPRRLSSAYLMSAGQAAPVTSSGHHFLPQPPLAPSQSQPPQPALPALSHSQYSSASAPQPQKPVAKTILFDDIDMESIPAAFKYEAYDWAALFVARTNDVNLLHSFENDSVVCCVKFSHCGKYLAAGCNRAALIFDIETGEKSSTLLDAAEKDGDLYIRSVCFSPDSVYLATGAEDRKIRVWHIKNQSIIFHLTGHEQDIYSLDYSNDGAFIASGSGDHTVKIWETTGGKCLFTLGNKESGSKDDGVTSVAFSPDGRIVAAGSLDRLIRLWNAQTGQFLKSLEDHKDSVYSVAFSRDGKSLVSGSLDKTLKVWDLGLDESPLDSKPAFCKTTFTGHKDFVLSVAFSPDGNVLSGSKDRSVQLWDQTTSQCLLMLHGHKNSVISVALSPKGKMFATGSGDCRTRVWSCESVAAKSS